MSDTNTGGLDSMYDFCIISKAPSSKSETDGSHWVRDQDFTLAQSDPNKVCKTKRLITFMRKHYVSFICWTEVVRQDMMHGCLLSLTAVFFPPLLYDFQRKFRGKTYFRTSSRTYHV